MWIYITAIRLLRQADEKKRQKNPAPKKAEQKKQKITKDRQLSIRKHRW